MAKVIIIKRNGETFTYSDYAEAFDDSVDDDLIQILADLNEQITLKNKVDIWINPGVIVKSGSSATTIVAPTSGDLECNIYGQGIIKNDTNGNCIFINNANAKLTIECNEIEGTGGVNSSVSINILSASKFHLLCNRVINRDWQAIRLGPLNSLGVIGEINLRIAYVETGNIPELVYTGTTAITARANGFIKINEILCRNSGHCFSARQGKILANIKKMTTVCNILNQNIACVQVPSTSQGSGDQELILYFDTIQSLQGEQPSGTGIEASGGKSIFIGRRVFSSTTYALSFAGPQTDGGYIKCNEIISQESIAVNLGFFTQEFNIYANKIESISPDDGLPVIYSISHVDYRSKYTINNAKIKNYNTSSSSKGIFFQNIYPLATLRNVKIVSGSGDGSNIFLDPDATIDVFNYGLFGNKGINDERIKLKIGTWLEPEEDYNFQCIIDTDLN